MAIQEDIVVARAPGRLDVMGGIADYSGSLVLLVNTFSMIHLFYWHQLNSSLTEECLF